MDRQPGEGNEQLAEALDISRSRQNECAARSHELADRAWAAGFYDDLVVPVGDLTRDESIGASTNVGELAGLEPSFRSDGTITAGNASSSNDGAAALECNRVGIAPVEAAERASAAAGIGWSGVGVVELDEAFA